MRASSASSRAICAFRLSICYLQLTDVGDGEGRVERREEPVLFDKLALAHVDALNDRRVKRLEHKRGIDRDDLSTRA